MSTGTAPTPLPRRTARAAGRVVRPVVRPARPVWEIAFRDPVVDSHLTLGGLSFAERTLARVGLVALTLLLVSVLFADLWRGGELLPVGEGENLVFLPQGLLPVTLVTFAIAWTALTWGALAAGPAVRLLVAVVFLLTNAALAVAPVIELGDQLALRWGPDVNRIGYLLPAGVLLLAAVLGWLPGRDRWLPRAWPWLLPVLRALCLAGIAMFFLGHLWMHETFVAEGFPGTVQQLVAVAVSEIDGLLLPLVYVSGVLVVDFSLDVAEGVAGAGQDLTRRLLRWSLVALLAVKLWFSLVDDWDHWVTYVTDRPDATVRTLLSILLLAVLVRLVTLFPATDAFDRAKERLLYGSGVALSLIQVSAVLVAGLSMVLLSQVKLDRVPGFVDAWPDVIDWMLVWVQPGLAAAAVAGGVWLLRRGRRDPARPRPMAREVGSGLVLIGGWAFPAMVLNSLELSPGFSYEMVDVLVTLGLVGYLARHWRTLSAATLVVLVAIAVFAWMVMGRGDWITFLGGLFGLPAILVVVVGILFSLAGDAAFTRVSTPRLPQGSRVLMFVGYLVLSVTILHWVEATHAFSVSGFAGDSGFFYLGLPWAAWLVGRRLLRLDDEAAEHADQADHSGDDGDAGATRDTGPADATEAQPAGAAG